MKYKIVHGRMTEAHESAQVSEIPSATELISHQPSLSVHHEDSTTVRQYAPSQ